MCLASCRRGQLTDPRTNPNCTHTDESRYTEILRNRHATTATTARRCSVGPSGKRGCGPHPFFFSTAYSHKLLKTNGHTAAFSDAAAAAVRHRVPTQGDKCGRLFAFSAKSGETQKPQPVTHRCTSILLCLALEANLSISDTFVKPLEDGLACVAQ